jgi:hypothetical protein
MPTVLLFLLISVFLADIAHAYVGPGLGLGVIGAIFGVVVAVFLAIVGVVWYPLKRMLRRRKAVKADTGDRGDG